MTKVSTTKLANQRLNELKKITGMSKSKIVEQALFNNMPFIPIKKIKQK